MKDEAFYRRLGVALRRQRDSKGLTQETAAQRIGVSRPSLANIERGRQVVGAHHLAELVRVLEIDDVAGLLLGQPMPKQSQKSELRLMPSRSEILDGDTRQRLLATIDEIRADAT